MIYLIFGHPGQGKSYTATYFACLAMQAGRDVFSNYPIIFGSLRSKIWKAEYAALPSPPVNAVVVIDEAYRDYNSRNYQAFTTETHTYLATNRHNNVDFYICVQNPARIDKVIREISQFILVRKRNFLKWIFGFRLEYYEFEEDLTKRKLSREGAYYRKEFIRFKKDVARAYDTHFYAKNSEKPFVGEYWKLPGEDDYVTRVINKSRKFPNLGELAAYPRVILDKFSLLFGPRFGRYFSRIRDLSLSRFKEIRARVPKVSRYDLFEPRGLVGEIAHKNYLILRPLFKRLGIYHLIHDRDHYV